MNHKYVAPRIGGPGGRPRALAECAWEFVRWAALTDFDIPTLFGMRQATINGKWDSNPFKVIRFFWKGQLISRLLLLFERAFAYAGEVLVYAGERDEALLQPARRQPHRQLLPQGEGGAAV